MDDPDDVPAQPVEAIDGAPPDAWNTLRRAAAVSVSSMSATLAGAALDLVPTDHPDRDGLLADQARSMLVLGQFDRAGAAASEVTSAPTSDPLSPVACDRPRRWH